MQTIKQFLIGNISMPGWLIFILVLLAMPGLIWLLKWFTRTLRRLSQKQDATDTPEAGKIKSPNPEKATGHEHRILKIIAGKGDRGVLLRTIADTLGINANNAKRSLRYLEDKKLIESVSNVHGETYYLTATGRMYCSKKGYI